MTVDVCNILTSRRKYTTTSDLPRPPLCRAQASRAASSSWSTRTTAHSTSSTCRASVSTSRARQSANATSAPPGAATRVTYQARTRLGAPTPAALGPTCRTSGLDQHARASPSRARRRRRRRRSRRRRRCRRSSSRQTPTAGSAGQQRWSSFSAGRPRKARFLSASASRLWDQTMRPSTRRTHGKQER